jgi:hypothetical protein
MFDYLDKDDKIWKLWNEQHPQFRDWIDRINRFAQSDCLTEDDVDNMQGEFEEGDYQNLFKRLETLKHEVQDLYFAIDNAYDYIEKLNKNLKLVKYTFEKINGDDDEFDFTISKDGEVLYTIHFDRESRTVSEHPHFYALNEYNKNKFNRSFRLMLFKKDNKTDLEFYEKV